MRLFTDKTSLDVCGLVVCVVLFQKKKKKQSVCASLAKSNGIWNSIIIYLFKLQFDLVLNDILHGLALYLYIYLPSSMI